MDKADSTTVSVPAALPPAAAVRRFGRFELRQLLGKSAASNTWLAFDGQLKAEVLLCVPRAQPADASQRDDWSHDVLAASRLKHPRLAEVLDIGVQDGWPFVVHERGGVLTLTERLQAQHPMPTVLEIVNWMIELLEALAYVHEAGGAHKDLQVHNIVIDAAGHARLAGVGVGIKAGQRLVAVTSSRQDQRVAAERDVLMAGLMLHRLLAGHPALDDIDLGSAAERVGLEITRLPWNTPQPVPETLRAICNRATDRQQRQRYLNARTLLSALQNWVKTNSQESAGPLALLMDRLETVGHLPSRSRDLSATLKVLLNDELKLDDMVDRLALDPALCWDLLRVVNTARYQSSGDDLACSLSRSIVLLGQQGLRKVCSNQRGWPGVLQASSSLQGQDAGDAAVAALDQALKRACMAAVAARWLRPFNIGDEEVMLAAMSQRLGRLLILYHFPEEASQMARLMASAPPVEPGGKPTPGMTLEAATSAVLGINEDDLTAAVLRHWGFPERFIHAARPLSLNVSPRRPEGPDDWLRITASLANELCALTEHPAARQAVLLTQLLSRYARPAVTNQKELVDALRRAAKAVDPALYRQLLAKPDTPATAGAGR